MTLFWMKKTRGRQQDVSGAERWLQRLRVSGRAIHCIDLLAVKFYLLSVEPKASTDLHCLQGEGAGSRLPREHHTVSAVQHGVGHVGRLGPGGARVLDHALKHLGGRDDGLARLHKGREETWLQRLLTRQQLL